MSQTILPKWIPSPPDVGGANLYLCPNKTVLVGKLVSTFSKTSQYMLPLFTKGHGYKPLEAIHFLSWCSAVRSL